MATLQATGPAANDHVNSMPAVEAEGSTGQQRALSLAETIKVIDTQLATAKAQADIAASRLTRVLEVTKMLNDYFKHLATLSTGSILIIITLHEKVFAAGTSKWVLFGALCPFLVSISLALFTQQYLPSMWTSSDHPPYATRFANFSANGSLIAFILGLVTMACVIAFGG